jgi:hypothetical protein
MGADPYIKPTNPAETKIDHVTIHHHGDAIFHSYRRFDVSNDPIYKGHKPNGAGMYSEVRIKDLTIDQLAIINRFTGLPLEDLLALQSAEKTFFEEGRKEVVGYVNIQKEWVQEGRRIPIAH